MPSSSTSQQKLFGLALSVKRGETPKSEVSDDVLNIVDTMSEKDIKDFAETSHNGLPKKVETVIRNIVREDIRERVLATNDINENFLHIVKRVFPDGDFIVDTYDGEPMSAKDAMEKMRIAFRGYKSYKYRGVSSDTPEYKKWHSLRKSGLSPVETYKKIFKESVNEESISTLGLSGMKQYASKHNLQISTKNSGGRVPYVTFMKDGKKFGPFDPTITTKSFLDKKILGETVNEAPTRRSKDFFEDDNKYGIALHKLMRGKWDRNKALQYFIKLQSSLKDNSKYQNVLYFIANGLGINGRSYKSIVDLRDDIITAAEKLYKLHTESINEADDSIEYVFKKDSGGGRPTMVLKLNQSAYDKVSHLFDDKGRPKSSEIKRIPASNTVWDLYSQKSTSNAGPVYKIYGVAGDWTFGNAPTFYQQKHRGNIKAANTVLKSFIDKYLKNNESINEEQGQIDEDNELLKADSDLKSFTATTHRRSKEDNVDILTSLLKKFSNAFSDVEVKFANLIKKSLPKKGSSGNFTFIHQTKTADSIIDKVLDRGKSIFKISDLVRGAVLFKSKEEMNMWISDFRRKYSSYISDYEFKQQGSDKTFGYYGSHHFDLKIDGLSVELQVMPAKLWKYKAAAHDIYNKWRSSPTPVPEIEKQLSRHLFRKGNESFVTDNVDLEDSVRSFLDQKQNETVN